MFIRHPELNSRDAISSSTRGKCHVLNPYLELNSRNTSKPTFEASLKHCRSRNQSKQPQLLPGFAWRNTLGAKCIRPPDRLAGKIKENSRRVKEKVRNRENREGMMLTSLKTKAFSPKPKPLPPFSLKRRRISLKREFVQWRPSLAAILAQASSDAANLA
ncbi:hypothetical protein DEO72_LG1g2977 [Vigna unguiculata]|uniref:Uncharacterized protein n=1 Tax=Vigna unguiculata TaxID=3917 RepID=A0A4D6KNT7_VIGUN|nr:hypothetical protein DEO72_LG1g2977 [Vigna unguiculata]